MADRHDYYFRQQVTEAELDEGFDYLEQADWDLVVDQGLDGIVSGLGVSENSGSPDLTVDVAAGTAYSHQGERINVVGTQDVDLSVDDLSVSTAVGSGGNEKWVSLFINFDRVLSDARIDGSAMTVFFDRLESYAFSVVQGTEASTGTATRPALDPSKVLLCDVLLTFGKTTILNADINTDRRETREFSSAAFAYGGGPDWADGTTNPATTVEAQLDKILTELAQEPEGSDRILSAAIAGSPEALTQGSIYDQLGQLLADVNARLPLAGGSMTGDLVISGANDILLGTGGVGWSSTKTHTITRSANSFDSVVSGTGSVTKTNIGRHTFVHDATTVVVDVLDLNKLVPEGATITFVRALVQPGAVSAGRSYGMSCAIYRNTTLDLGTPNAGIWSVVNPDSGGAARFDDGTTNLQTIEADYSLVVGADPLQLRVGAGYGDANDDDFWQVEIEFTTPYLTNG